MVALARSSPMSSLPQARRWLSTDSYFCTWGGGIGEKAEKGNKV